MSVPSVEEVTRNALEKGGVLAMVYFDVHGNDKEEVEGILVETSRRLTAERDVVYAVGEIERAIEMDDGTYSAAASVRILTTSFPALVRICALYSPIGVEILKPNEIKLSLATAHEVLNQVADASYAFMTTMLKKVLKPDEMAKLEKIMKRRAELGKELISQSEESEEG